MLHLFSQSPEPPDSWNGILDATEHRSHCPFLCFIRKKVVGSDDCLYLNVYTPDLNEAAGKPVIVFIHPGCYNSGSGNEDIYGADYLIDQDVILVTFNYRLTATGICFTTLYSRIFQLLLLQNRVFYNQNLRLPKY